MTFNYDAANDVLYVTLREYRGDCEYERVGNASIRRAPTGEAVGLNIVGFLGEYGLGD